MLSTILPVVAVFVGLGASLLALLGGIMWRRVADMSGHSATLRDAARFTSATLIWAGIAGVILLSDRLG